MISHFPFSFPFILEICALKKLNVSCDESWENWQNSNVQTQVQSQAQVQSGNPSHTDQFPDSIDSLPVEGEIAGVAALSDLAVLGTLGLTGLVGLLGN